MLATLKVRPLRAHLFPLSRVQFLALAAAWIATVPNAVTVLKFYRSPAAGGVLTAAGLAVGGWLFILTVTFGMLMVLALPFWGRWVKLPCALALLAAALLSFFTTFLGIRFDVTMMRNIVQTNLHEAAELASWRLGAWILLVGVLPAAFLVRTPLRASTFWRSSWQPSVAFFALLSVTGVVVYPEYSRHASTVRNRQVSFDSVAPANALVSTLHMLVADRLSNTIRAPRGLDARHADPISRPRLLILVVGETARARDQGLNGYERDTTPRMRASGGYYFADTQSCGTATTVSVPCIFSELGREIFLCCAQDRARRSSTWWHARRREWSGWTTMQDARTCATARK
jgi:Predicted membrane-associated, metal-dependent hydrolase